MSSIALSWILQAARGARRKGHTIFIYTVFRNFRGNGLCIFFSVVCGLNMYSVDPWRSHVKQEGMWCFVMIHENSEGVSCQTVKNGQAVYYTKL